MKKTCALFRFILEDEFIMLIEWLHSCIRICGKPYPDQEENTITKTGHIFNPVSRTLNLYVKRMTKLHWKEVNSFLA
jgi:hypothetical protein